MKSIKKISIIFTILFLLSITVNAQRITLDSSMMSGSDKDINAYTFERPVRSISDNFENLFQNIPRLVDNPDSIEFLNYQYVTTIKEEEEVKTYFYKNWYEHAPMVYYTAIVGDSETKVHIKLSELTNFQKEESIQIFDKWIAPIVHKGYQVYEVNFILNHQKIKHYVLVNPQTKEVVRTIFTFFGALPKADELG